MTMTLDQLQPGQSASIAAIDGDGPLVQRLMALGLLQGAEVTVTRKALGGDPIEIQVMDYSLSLRRDEARRIQVISPDG
jgi:Fe2+ transport system protein FeoA